MPAYKTTPVFDQDSLPAALRADHATKAGVWGVITVLEGALRLTYADGTPEHVLVPGSPGVVAPQQRHHVTPLGAMRMQVAFHDSLPDAL